MNEKINLQQLAALLSEHSQVDKKEAESFLKDVSDTIQQGLMEDNLVKIKNLGTFKLLEVKERESIDVASGERTFIPAHYKVSFTPEKALAELINEPFSYFETTELNENESESSIEEIITEQDILNKPTFTSAESEDLTVATEASIAEKQEDYKFKDNTNDSKKTEESTESALNTTHTTSTMATEKEHHYYEPVGERRPKKINWGLVSSLFALCILIGIFAFVFYGNKDEDILTIPNDQIEEITEIISDDSIDTQKKEKSADEIPIPATSPKTQVQKERILQSGERLTVVALEEYGHKAFWVYLYEENKEIITNPNQIKPGLKIIIPSTEKYKIDKDNEVSIARAKEIAKLYQSAF